jgi:hypothetical protein
MWSLKWIQQRLLPPYVFVADLALSLWLWLVLHCPRRHGCCCVHPPAPAQPQSVCKALTDHFSSLGHSGVVVAEAAVVPVDPTPPATPSTPRREPQKLDRPATPRREPRLATPRREPVDPTPPATPSTRRRARSAPARQPLPGSHVLFCGVPPDTFRVRTPSLPSLAALPMSRWRA